MRCRIVWINMPSCGPALTVSQKLSPERIACEWMFFVALTTAFECGETHTKPVLGACLHVSPWRHEKWVPGHSDASWKVEQPYLRPTISSGVL